MSDPGIAVLDFIYTNMGIDDRWSVRGQRGFTWWGKDFAQNIWAEPPFEDGGCVLSRVHARTDVLRNFSPSEENLVKLAFFNAMASLSALLWNPREPDRLRLAASMYVHDQNLAMVQRLFSLAVAVQAADAQIKAEALAALFGASCDSSPHPTSGARPDYDDMLNVIELLVAPLGERPSYWAGKEMKQAVKLLGKPPCVLCTGDKGGLAAEFPLLDRTMLLTMKSEERHPQLGNGLLVRISLPFSGSTGDNARDAAALNILEAEKPTGAPFLGSWCCLRDGIHFVCFYPNCAHTPGLLQNLVLHMACRARWVAEKLFGGKWDRTYQGAAERRLMELSLLAGIKPDATVH